MEYIDYLIKQIIEKKLNNIEEILNLRRELARKYKPKKLPSIIQILLAANEEQRKKLFHLLKTKPTRALQGVLPVAIVTKPRKCPHGKCIYCPGGPDSYFGDVPQSYTGKEPAILRAIRNDYNPYLQIFNRLEQYLLLGIIPSKTELIIIGGTFPSYPLKYQNNFIRLSLQAMNDFGNLFLNPVNYEKFINFFELDYKNLLDKEKQPRLKKKILKLIKNKSLIQIQKQNENSLIRNVALVIETRPDYCNKKHINTMLKQGYTRVELGIQTLSDKILKNIERDHTIKDTIKATQLLKDSCYKVGYQYMLGLPGSSTEKDFEMFKELFSNENYKPDALKIYPCMVLRGTKLYELYKKGKYKPLTTKQATNLIIKLKKYVPKYCRIMRIQRDIPTIQTVAGVDLTNLRQKIITKCNCIRCRQIRGEIKGKVKLNKIEYNASNGKEFFLSYETPTQLIGFLRLRIPYKPFKKEITNKTALIRELHVYGETLQIGKEGDIQHTGYGKNLLNEAERVAKEFNKNKLIVISGVGVRNYYKKFNYKLDGPYMSKILK